MLKVTEYPNSRNRTVEMTKCPVCGKEFTGRRNEVPGHFERDHTPEDFGL